MNNLIPIGEAARFLGVSIMTLRRWDTSGKLQPIKGPSRHRYYDSEALERFQSDLFSIAKLWASGDMSPKISKDYHSETQDRFRARLEKMAIIINDEPKMLGLVSLITALAGEIGNNSFDHNLGNWPDVPGVFFAFDTDKRVIVLADRGIGIKATLSRVCPNLKDDADALKVAMTEHISGRSPEQRGNGLKFVLSVATENQIGISLQSGFAIATIDQMDGNFKIVLADHYIRGVLTKVKY